MLRRLLVLVVIMVVGLPVLAQAQTANRVETLTGRLSLELPSEWIWRLMPEEEELQGLDSETLVLASSEEALDDFLNFVRFDGTIVFLSAYPYNVYTDSVMGFPADMMTEVTVLTRDEINQTTFAGFPAAEYLYTDNASGFFAWEILFDTGEMTYRGTTYSSRLEDHSVVMDVINSAIYTPVDPAATLELNQPTRTVNSTDQRLSFAIPENWLYWNEGDNTLTFASSGQGYEGLSYAFQPTQNSEIAFLVQRFMKSALRDGEINVDHTANLPAIAGRLLGENGGLQKDKNLVVTAWNGIPRLDVAWLIQGETESIQTRTILLDGTDSVYFVQAQYAARNSTTVLPLVDAIFNSMTYTAPAAYVDTSVVGLEPGQTAPDFSLPLLEGGEAALATYRGKVVLVNMWASWCGPCHHEAPHLQATYEEYGGRFEILAVNVGESSYEANGFTLRYRLSFPILLDDNEQVARLYGLTAYPTTYIIGRDGVVLDMVRGGFTEQGLRDILSIYVGK